MKISTRSRYGARLMLELAHHYENGPVRLSDVAESQGISLKYLEQLVIPLKKAGFVHSARGPKGGHTLAKPPQEVTLGEIVSVLEGDLNLTPCVVDPGTCDRSASCEMRDIWNAATKAMWDVLHGIRLSELKEKGVKGQPFTM